MTGPGAVSTFASSAPAASAVAPAAAGGGWASWISRLAPVATTAAGIVQGVQNSKAIDKANQEQKAATQAAMQIQQQAQQRAGDVYQQQRADTQNLFGQPYQTLGGLLGMNIAPIGPANGRIPTSAQPAGVPAALAPNVPMQAPYPGSPSNGQPLQGAPIGLWQNGPSGVPAATTLRALADVASRSKSSSSYSDGTAKRR